MRERERGERETLTPTERGERETLTLTERERETDRDIDTDKQTLNYSELVPSSFYHPSPSSLAKTCSKMLSGM